MAVVLVVCVTLVAAWEIMSRSGRNPFRVFGLTADDFAGFRIRSDDWESRPYPPPRDPTEPNILAFSLQPLAVHTGDAPAAAADPPLLVRLVHGYNMRDCMRLKGYEVTLIGGLGSESASDTNTAYAPAQVWRLVSSTGDATVWTTAMLRGTDFAPVARDVRSMPFPRIAAPVGDGWVPEGITLRGLRHPVRGLKLFLRAKWNNARCDVWTFLGLKRAAWASDELLTVVACWRGAPVTRDAEAAAARHVLAGQNLFIESLRGWGVAREAIPAAGTAGGH